MKRECCRRAFASGLFAGTGICLLLFSFIICTFLPDQLGRFLGAALENHPQAQTDVVLALKNGGLTGSHGSSLFRQYGYGSADFLPLMGWFLLTGLLFLAAFVVLWGLYAKHRRIKEQQALDRLLESLHQNTAENSPAALCLQESRFAPLERQMHQTLQKLQCSQAALAQEKEQYAESLASIAHQLKTPTASLRLLTEMLSPGSLPDAKRRMKKQLTRLSSLEESLLLLARLDHGTLSFQQQPLALDQLILNALDLLQEQAQQKHVVFHSSLQPVLCSADAEWTLQALLNVLKNALDYAPEYSTVHLELTSFPLAHRLLIQDEGPGVPAEDLPHLFERYYRSKHVSSQGCGIGLPLARELLEAQNASISLQNRPGGGLECDIRFYRS